MIAAVGLLSLAVLGVVGLLYLRHRTKVEAKRIYEDSLHKVLDQAEREKAQLTDPDKTPTPLESANAFRAYRDGRDGN